MHLQKFFLIGMLILVLATQACTLPDQALTPQVVTVVVTAVPTIGASITPMPTGTATTTPAPSPTLPPQDAAIPTATVAPSPTVGPQCTILKAINFRNGPGTAYNPILGSFAVGKVLIPTGYNPVGNPSGAWLQVMDPTSKQIVWIGAAAEFVECNLDMTKLAAIAVKPPPPPPAPVVSNLPAQGPKGGDIDFDIVMSPDYLMRILARKHGAKNDGDGMDHVAFTVKNKKGDKVYANTEGTAKYCIFQGGEPDCNVWPKSNGRYVWGSGGAEIVSGDYLVTIRAALKTDASNESEWTFQITIKLP
jgi:hypothetical protein